MAVSVTRGGAFRGTDRSDAHNAIYECPICDKMNTKRKSISVRGGRFCKVHGNESSIFAVMDYRRKKVAREAKAA